MELDIYWSSLAVLAPLAIVIVGRGAMLRGWNRCLGRSENVSMAVGLEPMEEAASHFRKVFFRVYLVVMASEWLQGPYIYSLFREEKQLSQWTVALLFVTYYSSAAISALFAGYLADRWGRRAACLACCVAHSLSSISVFFDHVEIFVVGRVLGGIALTLLWSTFESWMITEYHARGLDKSSLELSSMFGSMTTYNCINGIVAGILGHCIVITFGSKTDPFALGVLLNISASIMMIRTWNENKGQINNTIPEQDIKQHEHDVLDKAVTDDDMELRSNHSTSQNIKLWILSLISCCFEGAMFLLVYFWPIALKSSHDSASQNPSDKDSIPHGVIQACFMAIMVLGAVLFNALTNGRISSLKCDNFSTTITSRLRKFASPTTLLCATLLLCSISFALAAACLVELHTFCVFLLIQFCSGVYVPSMALHRSMIVSSNKNRTSIYGVIRIPLFLFVIGALLVTGMGEGDRIGHQQHVFVICSVLLLAAFAASVWGLRGSSIASSSGTFVTLNKEDAENGAGQKLGQTNSRVHPLADSEVSKHVNTP